MIDEKNLNGELDSLEYAKTALDIMRRGGTDEETARGLLKVANTSALVSIADSLRELVTVQRENQKRADEINGHLMDSCASVQKYADDLNAYADELNSYADESSGAE